MKRILALIMCAFLLLNIAACTKDSPVSKKDYDSLRQAILDSCTYGEKVDISSLDVSAETLDALFYEMVDSGQLPWYVDRKAYNYEYAKETGRIMTFQPKLLPEGQYDRAFYQQRLEEILQMCVFDWMEPWQIALSLHDYLAVYGDYDESLGTTTGYDLLKTGKTVCSGYTEVYRELMNMAGVPCVSVVSEPMEHTWNLVQLEGNWYHVDLTWDDPEPDIHGRAQHKYFLVTDEEISSGEKPHYDWETDKKCTDDRYSDAFWRDVDSPILLTDADTCYLIRERDLSNTVYQRTLSTGQETAIYEEQSEHLNLGQGSYRYHHGGLSLWDGRLWVSSMTNVRSMDLDGGYIRTELTYDAQKNGRYLAGTYVCNDTIFYSTMDHSGNPEKQKEELPPTGYHIHEYTQTVVKPTDSTPGYTVSECSCGIRCESTPTKPLTE